MIPRISPTFKITRKQEEVESSVVVANAPAGGVERREVREGEGGIQEGERKKGQRGGSVPPPVVVPTCRPLRSVGLVGQLKRCGTE